MKSNFKIVVFLILIVAGITSGRALGQSSLFVWGNVKWSTGYPAVGLEVRLIKTDSHNIAGRAYTNQSGRFSFYGVEDQPSDYSLQVCVGDTIRGETTLTALPIGGQSPDITIK